MEERHYCRNPRCRSKLKQSVADPRDAFCARGCHASFYRHRCLVCEGKMARKTENQLVVANVDAAPVKYTAAT
jgi:hypothetical protein